MKKILNLLLCFLMVATITGCQNKEGSAGVYKAGTYIASSQGYHGEVKLEVVVSEEKIEEIKILEHDETQGVGTVAVEKIPGWIIENQSLAADVVSGATITSNAIITAVEAALTEAGADIEALKRPIENDKSDEVVKLETDVLIIGSGSAGLTAAVSAKENGIENVLVIEKMSIVGGASAMAHGVWAAGSKAQAAAGVEDSADLMYKDLEAMSLNQGDPELMRMFADNSGRAIDWLCDNYGMAVKGPSSWEGSSADRNFLFEGSGAKLIEVLNKNAVDMGVTIQCDTEGKELIMEDGKVVGAIAVGRDGTTYEIKANKVLLATGGYGDNPEMLNEADAAIYYGPKGLTGTGHDMAKAVGAELVNMGGIAMKPVQIEVELGKAKNANAHRLGFGVTPAILVAKNGMRIASEFAGEAEMRKAMADNNADDLYMIMDQNAYDLFVQNGIDTKFFTEEEVEGWKTTEVRNMPILAAGASLDDVSAAMGVDAEQLKKTIETYNTNSLANTDEFGRASVGTLTTEGNYYILRVTGRFATTTGGVDINNELQVLNENGEPIEGLYAAGEIIGNVTGECNVSYLTWGIITGQIFGEVIATK